MYFYASLAEGLDFSTFIYWAILYAVRGDVQLWSNYDFFVGIFFLQNSPLPPQHFRGMTPNHVFNNPRQGYCVFTRFEGFCIEWKQKQKVVVFCFL